MQRNRSLSAMVLVAFTAILLPAMARAVPAQLSVQGVLFDETGAAVEGAAAVTVRLYEAADPAVAPMALWEPAVALDVLCEAGVFTALVPAAAEGPEAEAFAAAFDAGEPRWLGITPGGGAELTPRIPVVSVAYALVAGKAALADLAQAADVAHAVDCVGCVAAEALDPAVQAAFLAYDNAASGLDATSYQAAVDELAGLVDALRTDLAALQVGVEGLAAVARSGAYGDLTGTPDLSGYAQTADLAAVATSGAYGDLSGAPDICAEAFTCEATLALLDDLAFLQAEAADSQARLAEAESRLAESEARLYCLDQCNPAQFSDCRVRTCDGAGETCTETGAALPDGSPCAGGGECVSGQCATGLRCGGVLCPTLAGDADDQYIVGCNMRDHCEYANANPAGWRRFDVWIWVPPGAFLMGSPAAEADHDLNEEPQHLVTFARGFFIGKYEVTAEEYTACDTSGTCTAASVSSWDGDGWGLNTTPARGSHPQNGLDWQQAGEVCAWLVEQTGGSGGRRPSEAEWEYAAAGPVHRVFPWGDGPEADCIHAVYNHDGAVGRPWGCMSCETAGCSATMPVGSRPAGASYVGALDMAGNTFEWCQDWYHSSYAGAPLDGSAREDLPSTPAYRVLRGGTFSYEAFYLRSAGRYSGVPGGHVAYTGARCVRPLPQ